MSLLNDIKGAVISCLVDMMTLVILLKITIEDAGINIYILPC